MKYLADKTENIPCKAYCQLKSNYSKLNRRIYPLNSFVSELRICKNNLLLDIRKKYRSQRYALSFLNETYPNNILDRMKPC